MWYRASCISCVRLRNEGPHPPLKFEEQSYRTFSSCCWNKSLNLCDHRHALNTIRRSTLSLIECHRTSSIPVQMSTCRLLAAGQYNASMCGTAHMVWMQRAWNTRFLCLGFSVGPGIVGPGPYNWSCEPITWGPLSSVFDTRTHLGAQMIAYHFLRRMLIHLHNENPCSFFSFHFVVILIWPNQ